MKNKRKLLPLAAFGLGLLLQILYRLAYGFAMDEKGLMTAGHPLRILLWLTTAAALTAMAVLAARMGEDGGDGSPAGVPGAAGAFAMALGVLATVLTCAPVMGGVMGTAWLVLGILAALGLAWAGACRMKGGKVHFTAHLGVCLFLAIHVVSHYRAWSSTPQLLDYVYSLLGAVTLLFFAYYRMAADVGLGKRRMMTAMGLMAICLGAVALYADPYRLLFCGGIAWVGCELWGLREKTE